MKRIFVIAAFAASALAALVSCASKEDLAQLQEKVDGLSAGEIASMADELGRIRKTVQTLEQTDTELNRYIDELKAKQSTLESTDVTVGSDIDELKSKFSAVSSSLSNLDNRLTGALNSTKEELEWEIGLLQKKDSELSDCIDSLRSYADSCFAAERDWAGDTFSTLEQYNTTCEVIDSICRHMKATDELYAALKTDFDSAVADFKDSLTDVHAEIAGCLAGIEQCGTDLATARQEITAAYTSAIASVQSALDALGVRVSACEENISALQEDLAARVQSITFVSQYTDGKATWMVSKAADGTAVPDKEQLFYYSIQPSSLTSVLAASPASLKFIGVNTMTRSELPAPALIDIPVKSASVVNGLLAVSCASSSVDNSVFSGEKHLNICLAVNDSKRQISSEFVELLTAWNKFVNFGDPDFKAFCVDMYDGDKDGEISFEEAGMVVAMNAGGHSFSSVDGIWMFNNLTTLNLAGNSQLKDVDLSHNLPLSYINILDCPAVENLSYDDSATTVLCNLELGHELTVNGTAAQVCIEVDENTRKVISKGDYQSYWDTASDFVATGATSFSDGFANTNLILSKISTCAPANWCRAKGAKWYLPAQDEMSVLHFNGLKDLKGYWFWTSTELDQDTAREVWPLDGSLSKDIKNNYRAHAYAMKVL